jgi:hypothetical protein
MKDVGPMDNFSAMGFVIATKRVGEEEIPVGFMYREQPMDAQDSGWRIFAGDESQEYVDNADNSDIYSATTILTIDPSIRELLTRPVGSAFERDSPNAAWKPAEDFSIHAGDEPEILCVGGGWSMEVPAHFERYEEEDGDYVFAGEGRTVRLALWDFSEKTNQEIIDLHKEFIQDREADEQQVLETLDLSEAGIARMGFIIQESDEAKTYKVLYGYTIIGREVAHVALYYDDDKDRDWAMATWISIRMNDEALLRNDEKFSAP